MSMFSIGRTLGLDSPQEQGAQDDSVCERNETKRSKTTVFTMDLSVGSHWTSSTIQQWETVPGLAGL